MSRQVFIDFETFYVKNKYSVADLGNWAYTRHPQFDPYLLSVVDDEGDSWVGQPKDFNWDAIDGAELISHNAGFDSSVYEAMVERGLAPQITIPRWHCSANMTSALCNRRSLKDAFKYFYGVILSKAARDDASGKHWADMIKDGTSEAMLKYALEDSVRGMQLWKDHNAKWSEFERRLSDHTIRSAKRGVLVDKELLEKYTTALEYELFEIEKFLPWVKEGKKPTSSKAVSEFCQRNGIACPPVKDDDEVGYALWESTHAEKYPWVLKVGEWRSTNKLLSTLKTIKIRLRPDGTVESSLLYFGAHTGRWSGTSKLNFQNFRKKPLVAAGIEVDIRRLFVARPGFEFHIADLSQIEPRVLNWLAGNTEFLEIVAEGYSPYEAFARSSKDPGFQWTGESALKKGDPDRYALCKAAVLGLGYQCGSEGFVTAAHALAGLTLTEAQSKEIVTAWRADNPRITALWDSLDEGFKGADAKTGGKNFFEVELPSGRVMRYEDIRSSLRQIPQPDKDGKRQPPKIKRVFTADIGGSRKGFYGGKLTENITQAASRDVFGEKVLAFDEVGVHIPFHVHDELIAEVPEGTDPRDTRQIMSQPVAWMPGCPIDSEVTVSKHYLK